MNLAIVIKSLRESALLLACTVLGIVTFVVVFVGAIQGLGPQLMQFLSSVEFLRRMLELAYGIQLTGAVSSNILYAIAFLHPLVLALSWAFLIATTTRTTSGEIDNGTADLLLALPISRFTVYASATAVWVPAAIVVSFSPLLGVWIGIQIWEPTEPIQFQRFFITSICFCAMNLAVGGLSKMASCLVRRRGHAVAVVFAVGMVSVAMNFLEPFLPFIERIKFLSLLNYYRPAEVVRDGSWPLVDIIVLVTFAIATWLIGLWVYARKDISAP